MSCMAMVDKVALLGHLAHHGLQNDAVQPHALQPALPPVGLRFQDFGELRFRYAVTLTRFYKDLAADATGAPKTPPPLPHPSPKTPPPPPPKACPPLKAPRVIVITGIDSPSLSTGFSGAPLQGRPLKSSLTQPRDSVHSLVPFRKRRPWRGISWQSSLRSGAQPRNGLSFVFPSGILPAGANEPSDH